MSVYRKTEFECDYVTNGDLNVIKLIISLDKNKCENAKYLELLSKFITGYNEKYDNICACYDKSSIIKSVLTDELDLFHKLEHYIARVKSLENEVLNLNKKISSLPINKKNNIDDIKAEVLNVFEKYASNVEDDSKFIEKKDKSININIENSNKLQIIKENLSDIDYNLVDKINQLVPDNADILLKHIVKEINGSAKGLSDYVSLFQKYGKAIEKYNQIVYFQRKGCHFVKRVKL